jgi:hypothetical protein
MGEPLGYTPPCLCCRTSDDDGPHFEKRWKTAFEAGDDGRIYLFQPRETGPCAWVHHSCLMEFMLHTVTTNTEGKAVLRTLRTITESRSEPGATE